jgi:hypothetical protein
MIFFKWNWYLRYSDRGRVKSTCPFVGNEHKN